MEFDSYFIRHAESEGNAGLASDDPSTIPLTARGKLQAETLAASFAISPAIIVSSPYQRARETAMPLLARFPSAQRISLPIQEFTYLAPASWRGTNGAQRRPAVEAYWERCDPSFCDGAEAESFADFFKRIEGCLSWLSYKATRPIVLVCHEMFIRGVIWRCFSPSLTHAISTMSAFRVWQLATKLPNVSITRVTCFKDGSVAIVSPFAFAVETPNRQ